VVEPPRQELLRRLNRAPSGTAALVAMRGDLLGLLKERPHLKAVDADFRHLLYSWFNRGFLRLERIDWRSPAQVLEKLIAYEAVHEIRGWDDLRRRLADDRRCFAFFHPALPDEPLVFVEVALVNGIADRIQPLLDPEAPLGDVDQADTALFYSINNTQHGLRGISFGNFLIKQVVAELSTEFPQLEHFVTLSPMPRFAATVRAAIAGTPGTLDRATLERLLAEDAAVLCERSGMSESPEALLALLEQDHAAHAEVTAAPLQRLALAYLTRFGDRGRAMLDPVATFHLSNGARLERINLQADPSPNGLGQSFGVMVNYLYDPQEVEANHERFIEAGEIATSRALARERKKLAALLPQA
jgi:malonyl-CoA decarboxylase